jgi:hypothetical protein
MPHDYPFWDIPLPLDGNEHRLQAGCGIIWQQQTAGGEYEAIVLASEGIPDTDMLALDHREMMQCVPAFLDPNAVVAADSASVSLLRAMLSTMESYSLIQSIMFALSHSDIVNAKIAAARIIGSSAALDNLYCQ